jgi:UDP-N-acetylmuramyl pentapeptide synthase
VTADLDGTRDALRGLLRPGDVVLIKASRGVRLDELVEPLRALGRDLDAERT